MHYALPRDLVTSFWYLWYERLAEKGEIWGLSTPHALGTPGIPRSSSWVP